MECKTIFLKKKWNRIVEQNPTIPPTQHYNYQRHLYWSFLSHPRRLLKLRIRFIHSSDDKEECILPIVVKKTSRQLFGLSHFEHLDYDDVIATTSSPSEIKKLLKKTLEKYLDYRIYIPNINEHSLLFSAIGEKLIYSEDCISISLHQNYNQYLQSLSKHQQQNIRTSYNRMARNNIAYHLEEYDVHNKISHKMWKYLCLLHHKRHNEHVTPLDLLRNPYYHILKSNPNHHIFVLFENNVPMAYMAGLFSPQKNTYYVPRLSINEEYATYSPGIVLLCETIKRLISNGTNCIDLMLGDEPYKLAMGGTIHKNYFLDCKVKDLLF